MNRNSQNISKKSTKISQPHRALQKRDSDWVFRKPQSLVKIKCLAEPWPDSILIALK